MWQQGSRGGRGKSLLKEVFLRLARKAVLPFMYTVIIYIYTYKYTLLLCLLQRLFFTVSQNSKDFKEMFSIYNIICSKCLITFRLDTESHSEIF